MSASVGCGFVIELYTGERPVTLNAERKANRYVRAKATALWRHLAELEVRGRPGPVPKHGRVHIRFEAVYPSNAGVLPDTGALYPTEKAIVDGLVDAGVIEDDSGEFVAGLTSVAPRKGDVAVPVVRVRVTETERRGQ